jgi:hypothetical protein
MARSGRFGRLPRRAPDLSSSIVALMREYWNTQENLMVDAWQNGGEVDGQPVTDSRIVQFWKDRRDSMSRDDPLWDHYNNMVQQYQFHIEESKVGLAYAQHKMSAREVAKWYKGQAQQYVPDSEIYRTIMGQAAKFLDAARSQASASNAQARAKAYVKGRDSIYQTELYPSMYVSDGLTEIFRQLGYLGGSQNVAQTQGDKTEYITPGEGEDITSLQYSTGGAQRWDDVIAVINDPTSPLHAWFVQNILAPMGAAAAATGQPGEGKGKGKGKQPEPQPTGYQGTTMAGAPKQVAPENLGPATPSAQPAASFDWPIDQGDFERLLSKSNAGYDKLIAWNKKYDDVAPKSGTGSTAWYRQQQVGNIDKFQFFQTMDDITAYAQRRTVFESAISDPNASLSDQAQAISNYYSGLGSLLADTTGQNPIMTTALEVERRALTGDSAGQGRTIAEDALNSPFSSLGPAGASGDVVTEAAIGKNVYDTIQALRDNKIVAVERDPQTGMWTGFDTAALQMKYGNNYVIVPKGLAGAPVLSPAGDKYSELTGANATVQNVPVTYGQVYAAAPITMVAKVNPVDPQTGQFYGPDVPATSSKEIGVVVQMPKADGTGVTPYYGIYINGAIKWTSQSPFTVGSVFNSQYDPQNGLTVVANPTAPNVGGVDAQGKPFFNPQGPIDQTLFAPGSTQVFSNFAVMQAASTTEGRKSFAALDTNGLLNVLQADPWMDWNNADQVSQTWKDIAAIKQSVADSQFSGYEDTWNFYKQLNAARGTDPGIWNTAVQPPDPTGFAASVASQGLETGNLGVAIPGVHSGEFVNLVAGIRMSMFRGIAIATRATANENRFEGAPPSSAGTAQLQNVNPFPSVWKPYDFTQPGSPQLGPQAGPPPIQPYSQYNNQPTITQAGNISMPNMPAPTVAPGALTPMPTPPPIPAPSPPPINIPPPPGISFGGNRVPTGPLAGKPLPPL